MTLANATALVALVDSRQPASAGCRSALETLSLQLVTTCSALAEAMHLLHRIGGWPDQRPERLHRRAVGREIQYIAREADTHPPHYVDAAP